MFLKISLMLIMSLSLCAKDVNDLGLIPQPKEVIMTSGSFNFTSNTALSTSKKINPEFLNFCAELLSEATGTKTKLSSKGSIKFILDPRLKKLSAEGYQLSVTKDSVKIVANDQKGLFYGFQTFRQLLPPEAFAKGQLTKTVKVPCVEIVDDAQFSWRGILVDVSRRFQPKENILKILDAMAICKLNTFHWHLTDDQGWRLEIKKFPNLTAKSKEFYTQEDIKEIVACAAQRNIIIVPEIDVPGHSRAAIKAYPELKCFGKDGKPVKSSGTYCPASKFSYQFLDGVMAEVSQLFPGKYVHIGADEVGTRVWRSCPHCQALMKEKKLKRTHDLESYFVTKVSKIVEKYNRKVITWDEALNDHVDKNRTIMSWRGCEPGMKAAEMGLDTIICPVSSLYFDRTQSRSKFQKRGYSLNTVNLHLPYFMNPASPLLSANAQKHVLGAQGCIWGEWITPGDHVLKMAMLRGCALAESTWTAKARDWNNFLSRLEIHRKRLDAMKIAYFWEPISTAIEVARWQTKSSKENSGIQTFDVSKYITGNDFYEFTFHTATGDNFIVESAELVCEGKVVAADKHSHTTTIDPRRPNQFYHLRLNDFKKGKKYQLRVTTKMSSTTEVTTVGVAMLIPPLGENYSEKAGPDSPANGQKYKAPDVK